MIEYDCRATLLHPNMDGTPITFPIGAALVGYRLSAIHIRLTAAEIIDPRVRAWLLEVVLPRRAAQDEAVHIELGGQ